jgi:lipoprotein-anchoring transpeptidase ErfK/SrfK
MNPEIDQTHHALHQAQLALKKGDRRAARRWAEQAAALSPHLEEPWLLLAAIASPRASVAYLKHALEINPQSQRARKGIHWAVQRWRTSPPPARPRRQIVAGRISPQQLTQKRPAVLPWAMLVFLIVAGLLVWFGTPTFSMAISEPKPIAQMEVQKSTLTPTPTVTFTASPTPTLTPTPTDTPTPTPTFTPTDTPTPLPTDTPVPQIGSYNPPPITNLPPGVEPGDRWIDVDLTNQRVYTYEGKSLIGSFITSTGTWRYPTVTGQYRIYVKYLYADMAGPGYYLPNVPYVMYFYKGYGIHGTYWHNNFGTPMSHGCVNLRTDDAGWVYNWSSIGTLVNIHY